MERGGRGTRGAGAVAVRAGPEAIEEEEGPEIIGVSGLVQRMIQKFSDAPENNGSHSDKPELNGFSSVADMIRFRKEQERSQQGSGASENEQDWSTLNQYTQSSSTLLMCTPNSAVRYMKHCNPIPAHLQPPYQSNIRMTSPRRARIGSREDVTAAALTSWKVSEVVKFHNSSAARNSVISNGRTPSFKENGAAKSYRNDPVNSVANVRNNSASGNRDVVTRSGLGVSANSSDSRPNGNDNRPKISDNRPNISENRPNIRDNRPNISDIRPNISDSWSNSIDNRSSGSVSRPHTSKIDPNAYKINFSVKTSNTQVPNSAESKSHDSILKKNDTKPNEDVNIRSYDTKWENNNEIVNGKSNGFISDSVDNTNNYVDSNDAGKQRITSRNSSGIGSDISSDNIYSNDISNASTNDNTDYTVSSPELDNSTSVSHVFRDSNVDERVSKQKIQPSESHVAIKDDSIPEVTIIHSITSNGHVDHLYQNGDLYSESIPSDIGNKSSIESQNSTIIDDTALSARRDETVTSDGINGVHNINSQSIINGEGSNSNVHSTLPAVSSSSVQPSSILCSTATLQSASEADSYAGDSLANSCQKDGHYFLSVLEAETSRLTCRADEADKYLSDPVITEDARGKVRAAVGKSTLLTTKKFKQFEGLCNKNIMEKGVEGVQFGTTDEDLAGFWDLVNIQITDVDALFNELIQLSQHAWDPSCLQINSEDSQTKSAVEDNKPDQVPQTPSGAKTPANRRAPKSRGVTPGPTPSKSGARNPRASNEEARRRLMEAKQANRQRKATETTGDEIQIFVS